MAVFRRDSVVPLLRGGTGPAAAAACSSARVPRAFQKDHFEVAFFRLLALRRKRQGSKPSANTLCNRLLPSWWFVAWVVAWEPVWFRGTCLAHARQEDRGIEIWLILPVAYACLKD